MAAILEIRFTPGSTFTDSVKEAMLLQKSLSVIVTFNFNGCTLYIQDFSTFSSVEDDYNAWRKEQSSKMG